MRTLGRCSSWFWRVLAASLLALGQAAAAAPRPTQAQAMLDALTQANAAVVGVQVRAIDGSRTAQTLGQERNGSGVVIGPDGLILTIGYLMLEADQIQIVTQDHKTLPARAVAYDLATGFGLLKPLLPLRGIKPVKLGSLKELELGEPVVVATGGEDGGVAVTQLVSKRAFSGNWEYHIEAALFTSPPIADHSGAPLFNRKGELVGIGSLLVLDATGKGDGLPGNMFVPVDLLKPILAELQKTGSSKQSRRPWLGLTSSDQGGHVQVLRVNPDSPAQSAGLQPGDLVLAVDGTKVVTLEAFYKKLWDRAEPDAEIQLTVLQGADVKTISVHAVDRMTTLQKPAGI